MTAYVAHSTAGAAIAQAIKASGSIVALDPADFTAILRRTEKPLVVTAPGGIFRRKHAYLTSYKGLSFHTESRDVLALPSDAEVVHASRIWIPG